ncbi:hypothetical protein HHX47_DHR4000326 [Lentinula edodes]|nr:hypothetical protein HHX47_DHR7000557 [Lentinula edodes]KAF8827463.1 hypothetical protein HHX47_DHR4000326 [Lentinula edodes]
MCWKVTNCKQIPHELQLKIALAGSKGNDAFVVAGTGSGKTLASVLNQLLVESDEVTVMLSPLKRLQLSHVESIQALYSIETVAINEDTTNDNIFWEEKVHDFLNKQPGSARLFLVTPEQCWRNSAGHLTRWGHMIRQHQFKKRVRYLIIDESHSIPTQGIAQYGLPAFRPAYGRLDELRVLLGPHIVSVALTATAPPHMCKVICAKALRPNHTSIITSSNRANTIYATHTVIGSIDNLENYKCFIQQPFDLSLQPRILIFREHMAATVDLAQYLTSCLPPEYHHLGIIKHYHSGMSPTYLKETHYEFARAGGSCRILVATSAESTEYGRVMRQLGCFGLAVLFSEQWVLDLDPEDFTTWDCEDLDRPCGYLKQNASAKDRAPFSLVVLVQTSMCLRLFFATYLGDASPEACNYSGPFCCDRHPGSGFTLQAFLPGPLLTVSESDVPSAETSEKRKHKSVRPLAQRKALYRTLQEWLENAHCNDRLSAIRPRYYILSDANIKTLANAKVGELQCHSDVTNRIAQTAEWGVKWATSISQVIVDFDSAILASQHSAAKRAHKKAKIGESSYPSAEFIVDSDVDDDIMEAFLQDEKSSRKTQADLRRVLQIKTNFI